VLNKFPINPHHFILATKEYKEQTHMLEEDDIEAAYACLKKYSQAGEELFGFFNSGEHSGASQPHRHIQFLPVESMQSGMRSSDEWNVLADSLAKKPSMYHALWCKDLFLTFYRPAIHVFLELDFRNYDSTAALCPLLGTP
jgi:ATP adenylyltransferase